MIVETAITTHSRRTTFSQTEEQRLCTPSQKKVDLGGKTDAIGSNKEHAAAAEQMAHKEQFA